MFKKYFVPIFCLVALNGFATIRTVSNFPATIAQFNTIQLASNASANGDTILVHGSPINYVGFTITDKRLTIMGPGWSPTKEMAFAANIAAITLVGVTTSGTEIHGLTIYGGFNCNTAGIHNVKIIRNFFKVFIVLNATQNGWLVEGNYFDPGAGISGTNGAPLSNWMIRNNVFFGYVCLNHFLNSNNVIVDHNLFLGIDAVNFGVFGGSGGSFVQFSNNIFTRRLPIGGGTNCTYTNNITFNCGGANSAWEVNGNVNAGGNIANTDPQMVDQAAVNSTSSNPLLNFTIAAGPANNAGADGKDMGLLFDAVGTLNWTNSRVSRLPYINKMNVVNPTVATGASISIIVEAKTAN